MAVKADITIDIDKQVGELQNLSQIYNARVGDNKTPLTIAWRKNDLPLNLKGLHAYIVGKTGDGSYNNETGKIDFPVGSPVSQFEDDGSGTLDGGQSGLTTLLIPKQMWQKNGIFAGYIGLKSEDGSVFTSKDIWFKVLGNVLDAGVEINYFIGDFNKALAEAEKKLQDKVTNFDQVTNEALENIKNEYQQKSVELKESYQNALGVSKDAIENDIAALNKLAASVGSIQAQITAKDIVTRKEHHSDIANLQQYLSNQEASMTKTLAGISKSGPYFFADLAELQSLYPGGHEGILVTRDNLHWCYWDSNQKQYIDCGKFTDSNNGDIDIDELSATVTNNTLGIRSGSYGYSAYHDLISTYNPNADQKLDLTKKVIIPSVFNIALLNNCIVNITSITVKPYQEGKLEIGVAHPYGIRPIKFKTSQTVELTSTDIQTIPLNGLELRLGDYLTIAGPVYYSQTQNGQSCGVIDKAGTTPLTGIHDEEAAFGPANFSFYVTVGVPETSNTLFPSRFLGKTISYQNKEFYDANATASLNDLNGGNHNYLVPPAFKDNGFIKRIYYDAPDNGYITLGTANVWDSASANFSARIHNNVKIAVTKGQGQADIYLPFMANDYLIVGGQVCYMQNDANNLFIGDNSGLIFSAQNVAGNVVFAKYGADINNDVKLNVYFDTEIEDTSHQEVTEEVVRKMLNHADSKKYVCFGDSIWSDQVAGIGTSVQKDLNAQMIGNFAVGWATCQDWFDQGKNITPISLIEPQNTDTADNVLSNQVRRMLQWTTEKDQIIKWQHPVDGWFNIDGGVGMGLGHTDDIPDIIAIAISTNDGKHDQCGNLVDDTDQVFQQHYKDLTRNSIASALRWAVETFQAAYPNAKIFICTPLQTNGSNSWMSYQNNLKKAEIIKKVGAFCSVPVIDQFSESGLNSQTVVHGTADGIHPSGKMRDHIAEFDARQIERRY